MNRRHETLGRRLWALVPAQLAQPPSQRLPRPVRRLFGRVQSVVREALDLPSRTELSEAMVRLEDVSRRLDTLAATEIRDLGDQVSGIETHQVADHAALAEEREEVRKLRAILERELGRAGALVPDAEIAEAEVPDTAPATPAETASAKPADEKADKKAKKKAKKADKKAGKKAKKKDDEESTKADKKAKKKADEESTKADKKAKKKADEESTKADKKAQKKAKKAAKTATAKDTTGGGAAATVPAADTPTRKKGKKKTVINVGSPKAMKERKRNRNRRASPG